MFCLNPRKTPPKPPHLFNVHVLIILIQELYHTIDLESTKIYRCLGLIYDREIVQVLQTRCLKQITKIDNFFSIVSLIFSLCFLCFSEFFRTQSPLLNRLYMLPYLHGTYTHKKQRSSKIRRTLLFISFLSHRSLYCLCPVLGCTLFRFIHAATYLLRLNNNPSTAKAKPKRLNAPAGTPSVLGNSGTPSGIS